MCHVVPCPTSNRRQAISRQLHTVPNNHSGGQGGGASSLYQVVTFGVVTTAPPIMATMQIARIKENSAIVRALVAEAETNTECQ
jgi:hypothetical protein